MLSIDEIINQITNFNKEITELENIRNNNINLLNELINKCIGYKFDINIDLYNKDSLEKNYLVKKTLNTMIINSLKVQDIIETISKLTTEINELKEFNNKNHDWEGGKCLGDIIDTPDGCRIRFDEQSRSFKFKNYKKSDTTIICETKEECYLKAKKYLYDYFNNLGKISNQYKFIHPKYIQVKLPNELTFITDSKFIDLIEKNKISSKYEKKYDNHYVMYLSGHKEHTLFYKLIGNYSRVKYLNENTLDLRIENLEETDNSVLAKISTKEIEFNDKTNEPIKPKLNKDGYEYNTWILGKYSGTVFERTSRNCWCVVVKKEDGSVVTKTLTFNQNNKDEFYNKAVQIRNEMSDSHELTKNKIKIISDDVIEVKLTKDQIMITDYKFIELINKYNLYSTKSSETNSKYYAVIDINGKMEKFHKHITGFDMVDHIDRNPLNNCLVNLRKADHKLNNNNRNISENSNAEVLGVTYCPKDDCFRARIKQDGQEYSKQFSVKKYGYDVAKQMAIDARKDFNKLFSCSNG